MSWIAIDTLGDVREATQSLLVPVTRGTWFRLAVIGLFVGVGGGLPTGSSSFSAPQGEVPVGGIPPVDLPPRTVLAVAAALFGLAILFGLLWSAVGAVMEFVLFDGLRRREIRIRRPFRTHLGQGLRLFVFRTALFLAVFALLAAPLAGIFVLGVAVTPLLFALILPAILLFALVGLVASVVAWLTTDFVVPTMLVTGDGVIDGWRRVYPTVRAEWKQVGLYLVLRFVLAFAAGIAVALILGLLALVLAIPFVVAGAAVFLGLSTPAGPGTVTIALLVLLGLLFGLSLLVLSAIVQVPVVTFFRYYALFVLGGLDADLDLAADLRSPDVEAGGDRVDTDRGDDERGGDDFGSGDGADRPR